MDVEARTASMNRHPRRSRIPDAFRTVFQRLGPRLAAGLAAAAVALFLFTLLAREMSEGDTMRVDTAIRHAVHGLASPRLTAVVWAATELGSPAVIVLGTLVASAVFLRLARTRAAILLLITMAGAEALDQLLKLFFHRPRPLPFFDIPPPASYSFPSGHAFASFCFYGVLGALIGVRVERRWVKVALWVAAGLVIAAVGFSRVYLGVHYPSDVLAGYAVAFVWVLTVASADRVLRT